MTNLSIFDFEGQEVRFVGTAEKPEWVAQDIAEVLGIQNIRQNLEGMEDYKKGVCDVYTPGGVQKMTTVTEPGLYALMFKSRKTQAKKFQRWVFEEILPTIRKTGSYNPNPEPPRQLPSAIEYLEAIKQLPDITNPILKAALEQRFAEELGASSALAPRTSVPVLAAVLARELGFDLKPGEDATLGKWVRKYHEPIGKAQHGRYSVCVYEREEIESTIRQYFDRSAEQNCRL